MVIIIVCLWLTQYFKVKNNLLKPILGPEFLIAKFLIVSLKRKFVYTCEMKQRNNSWFTFIVSKKLLEMDYILMKNTYLMEEIECHESTYLRVSQKVIIPQSINHDVLVVLRWSSSCASFWCASENMVCILTMLRVLRSFKTFEVFGCSVTFWAEMHQ